MNQDEIRTIAQQAADEMYGTENTEMAMRFVTRVLAAITEKAEPVAWLVRDQVDGLRYPCNQKNPAGSIDGESEPLFTHPAIEPAPLSARSLTDELMDCVDRLGSEYNTVDPRVWEHLMVYAPTPVGAPPLPDEVREIVDRLRAYPTRDGLLAADMIERLARQVPPDCVVVPWAPTEVKNG